MIFKVKRSSDWFGNKPCDEAFKKIMLYHDERTVSTPNDINDETTRNEWYTKGTNHRVENGHIIRDIPTEEWVVRVNSLNALMVFIKRYGVIVLSDEEIEIYDDYRE